MSAPAPTVDTFSVSNWHPVKKGETLQGFFSLRCPSGLIVNECSFHKRDSERWVSFPHRGYEAHGKKRHARLIEFDSKEAYRNFQERALDALNVYFAGNGGEA